MKATDLMIGDWVLCDGKAYQVAEISAGLLCIDAERELFANPEDLQPIPLTPEILEKNGFKRSRVFVEWKYENDNVYMIYKPFPYLKIQMEESVIAFPCKFIHQLQHALRLCKIEKEIII